jgi:hypothetical protein
LNQANRSATGVIFWELPLPTDGTFQRPHLRWTSIPAKSQCLAAIELDLLIFSNPLPVPSFWHHCSLRQRIRQHAFPLGVIAGIWYFLILLPPAKLLDIHVPTPKQLPAGLSIRPFETPLELETAVGIGVIHPRSVAHKLAETTFWAFDMDSDHQFIALPLKRRFEKIRISTDEGFVRELRLRDPSFSV